MSHRLSIPFSFLPSINDDDASPIDSSHSTPRSSFLFFFDSSDSLCDDNLRPRPHSLSSVDSGYFSIMGKESPISKSFTRKPSGGDLRLPLAPINSATDPNQESPKREGVIRSLLRKKKKSTLFPPDIDPFTLGLSHRVPTDDMAPQTQQSPAFSLPPPRSSPRDPSVDAFEQQDRFVVRRGMKHHPYPRDDAPYMLAYDRTLLDKYVSFP